MVRPRSSAESRSRDRHRAKLPGERGFALWRDAMRWQRSVDEVLRPHGLTHTRFLALAAAAAACREDDDAVSQSRIGNRAGLDKVTTSRIVRGLEERGWLDRGPTFEDERQWRVIVTKRGHDQLRRASRLVESAEERFFHDARG